MMRKNSKNVLVGFLVSSWLIGMLIIGNVPLAQILNEEGLTEIKSSGIEIENEYDFSKGTMENVSIDEKGRLSLEIDPAAASLWVDLTPTLKPSTRHYPSMVYDSDSQKVILFGGFDSAGYDDETWTYDLGTNLWTNMNPTLKPSARRGHSMVYDSDTQKVILFGGYDSATWDDETWTYDLGTNLWTNMNPTLKPSARYRHSIVYDSNSQKVILFGGQVGANDDETWTYDLGTNLWTNMNPTIIPSARYGHSMVYDSDSQKVILFGGVDSSFDDETWTYDLWTNLWTNMNPTIIPSARYGHSMVYDSDSQKVILFGGWDIVGLDDETWTYDFGTNLWTNMNPTLKPSGRYYHSMVYDSDSQKFILFGGYDGGYDDETWMYSLNQYFKTGQFDSQLMDVEYTCPITGEISWNPSVQPAETVLELQVGFSNTTDEADFVYTPSLDSGFTFEGIARYIKYRAYFESDPSSQFYTPYLETVSIHYTLGIPDYMDVFLAYLDGNATLIQYLLDWSEGNATLLSNLFDSVADNATLLENIANWLDGNSTEIATLLTLMEGNATQVELILTQLEGNATLLNNLLFWSQENATILSNLVLANQDTTLLLNIMDWLEGNASVIQDLVFMVEGNATLLLYIIETLEGNVTLLDTVMALATQNIEYLNSLNATLSGNITLLREIVDQLGIVVGDADYDGLSDLDELEYGTNLLCSDTDCDNLNDAFEIKYGTDPLNDDSDGDTWLDGVEAAAGTDPKNAADYPGASPTDTSESSSWPIYAGIGGGVALIGVAALLVVKNKKK